eukprot:COSAG02_NODE_2604_length_8443_cov_6.439593_3_plen_91_part_00
MYTHYLPANLSWCRALWVQEVGDRVECNTGEWMMGTVIKQWFRETEWAQGTWAAYQVMLDTGRVSPGQSSRLPLSDRHRERGSPHLPALQ